MVLILLTIIVLINLFIVYLLHKMSEDRHALNEKKTKREDIGIMVIKKGEVYNRLVKADE